MEFNFLLKVSDFSGLITHPVQLFFSFQSTEHIFLQSRLIYYLITDRTLSLREIHKLCIMYPISDDFFLCVLSVVLIV
jgi:hypothetical protein